MAIFCHTWYARGVTYQVSTLGDYYCYFFYRKDLNGIWSNPSAASTQQQRNVLILPPTQDHEQSGRSYFVGHVGQTGALASEAGQG